MTAVWGAALIQKYALMIVICLVGGQAKAQFFFTAQGKKDIHSHCHMAQLADWGGGELLAPTLQSAI